MKFVFSKPKCLFIILCLFAIANLSPIVFAAEPNINHYAMEAYFQENRGRNPDNAMVYHQQRCELDKRDIYVLNFPALFCNNFEKFRELLKQWSVLTIKNLYEFANCAYHNSIMPREFGARNKDAEYIFETFKKAMADKKWRNCNTFVIAIDLDDYKGLLDTFRSRGEVYAGFKNFRGLDETVAPTAQYYADLE